ncbi:nSTAND1 domain-containing NTPase [Streptomyces sp. NRAIS4]
MGSEPSERGAPEAPVTFGGELRRLRRRTGMSLAVFARAVHYSPGHISRIENGEKRPSEDLARRCDALLDAGGALLALAVGPVADVCPYPGLAPFGTEDARWFFGRDRALAELVCLLGDRSTAEHPVMLIGPSGVGKSSLLRAGLAPAVARGALPGRAPGAPAVLCLTPTAEPVAELRARAQHRPLDSHALLIVDQFEELFTLCGDEADRDAFADELCRLARAGLPVTAGVRADFYGHCLAHPGLREALRTRSLPLGPMSRAELRQAITEPAAAAGLTLEPGLAEVLLRDLGDHACEAGALPLLSHALRATWQHRVDGVLAVAGYERTGGVHGAVAASAERAYARLGRQQREAARTVLLAMVRIGEDTADTRRRAGRRELAADADAGAVVAEFTRSRLLTADADHVEISHEALLHAWPRLKEWIDAERGGLLVRQRLMDDAAAWETAGRDTSHLYGGTRLVAADEWYTVHAGPAGTLEREFLTASRRQQRRSLRRARQVMAALTALTLVSLVAVGIAVDRAQDALRKTAEAASARLSAEADAVRPLDPALAATLAVAAHHTDDTERSRSALIGSSAPPYATRYLSDGPTVVKAWGASPDGRLLAEGTGEGTVQIWDTRWQRPRDPGIVRTPKGVITQVAVHPRHLLALATDTGLVQLCDLSAPRRPAPPRTLLRGTAKVTAMEFSTDGSRLAIGDWDGGLTLWDTTDPRSPVRLLTRRLGAHVLDLSLSRDGRTLATVEGDELATVWDIGNPVRPVPHRVPPTGRNEYLHRVALSPDGHRLALVSYQVSGARLLLARVTDDGSPGTPRIVDAGPHTVTDLAFRADGGALALGNGDALVDVWQVREARGQDGLDAVRRLELRQPGAIVGLAFGPDGTSLGVGTPTTGSRVWHPLPPLAGHTDALTALEPGPHRDLVITTSKDGTALLWRVPADGAPRTVGTPLRCAGLPLAGAAFSPDGRMVALTTFPPGDPVKTDPSTWAAVCLWDIHDPGRPRPMGVGRGHVGNTINEAAFSADGRTVVTGANGNDALTLWDVSDPHEPHPLRTLPLRSVTSLARLGTSSVLAVGSSETQVQLWDIGDPRAPRLITRLRGAPDVADLAADRNGRFLAAGSYDQRAYLWDVTHPVDPVVLPSLEGHRGTVWQVDFDASGKHLLTTNGESPGPARIWDLSDRSRPRQTAAVQGPSGVGLFTESADGFLVTTSSAVQRWATSASSIARTLCATAGSPPTSDERRLYDLTHIDQLCHAR